MSQKHLSDKKCENFCTLCSRLISTQDKHCDKLDSCIRNNVATFQ